jgi:exosortase O
MSAQQPPRPRLWQALTRAWAPSVNWPQLALNAAVVGLWLWLFRPTFNYLFVIFGREDFRTNQILLLAVLALIVYRLRRDSVQVRLDARPHLHTPALVLATLGAVGYVLTERILDINIVSSCLFGLATYGLLGLWMPPRAWREGLPAALLLIGALPFGDFVDVFIGYPARIATAAIVRDGLAAGGVASVGIDTILVFENGVSQVDLPCSGVKSLWTGALFLVAATWVERRSLGLRWLGVALAFALVLFLANTARVAALVLVGEVLGLRLFAEMLHVPLGVLAFVGACAAGLGLLRFVPTTTPSPEHVTTDMDARRTKWLAPGLLAGLLVLNLVYVPALDAPPARATVEAFTFPTELNAQPLPLRPGELAWLFEDGAERVDRIRFDWRGHTGSLLLVTSTHWRAHHKPERCFENDGLRAQTSATHLVDGQLPVRVLSLAGSESKRTLSAAYWFQSATRATDDYSSRLWSALSPQPEQWVMVSALFDQAIDPRGADAEALYLALERAAQASLQR